MLIAYCLSLPPRTAALRSSLGSSPLVTWYTPSGQTTPGTQQMLNKYMTFPGSAVVKNPSANAGDARDVGQTVWSYTGSRVVSLLHDLYLQLLPYFSVKLLKRGVWSHYLPFLSSRSLQRFIIFINLFKEPAFGSVHTLCWICDSISLVGTLSFSIYFLFSIFFGSICF